MSTTTKRAICGILGVIAFILILCESKDSFPLTLAYKASGAIMIAASAKLHAYWESHRS